ncbi:hypothetical protein JVU11DRAFT_12458 [Chiua virens]|nr:hypothetical protein JVU11DRAFT_12458 [Chiua virens]
MCAVPSAHGIHHVKTIQPTDSSQIPDRSELMIKIHRILCPGGFLVFFEPDQSISRKLQKCGPALAEVDHLLDKLLHIPRSKTLDEQPKSWSIAHELEHVIYNSKDSSGSAPLFKKGDIKPFFLPIGTWPEGMSHRLATERLFIHLSLFKDPIRKETGRKTVIVQMWLI